MKHTDFSFDLLPENQTVYEELCQQCDDAGITTMPSNLRRIAVLELEGNITELGTGETFKPSHRWDTFVAFWMDWMWRAKQQRNYIKLAHTMQAIAQRDGSNVSQADDFDTWCELSKHYRERYFQRTLGRIAPLLVIIGLLFSLTATPAQAAPGNITVSYLGTEIIDENGTPSAINAYYIDCAGGDFTITLAVHFVSGDKSIRPGDHYCQAKIYLYGYITLVEVIAAIAAQQPVDFSFVYLPIVTR